MKLTFIYDSTLAETTISEIQTIIQKITEEQYKTKVSTNSATFFAKSDPAENNEPQPEFKAKLP